MKKLFYFFLIMISNIWGFNAFGQYAGVWQGTTSQNRPIYFRVNEAGIIDSLMITIRMSFSGFYAVANFDKDTTVSIQADSFAVGVSLPSSITNVYSRVRGSFASSTSAQGTYDGFSGSYYFFSSTIISFGTGTIISKGTWQATRQLTDIEDLHSIPTGYSLDQNFPNPFNPSTSIRFSIPHASFVSLKVFNLLGEEVGSIVNQNLPAGTFNFQWNASGVPSGVYFYKIQAGQYTQSRKMVVIK